MQLGVNSSLSPVQTPVEAMTAGSPSGWCGAPLQRPVALLPVGPPPLHGVSVTLQNADLWHQFHRTGTEMIITKLGRRMFPALRLRLSGLEPDARYFVVLELRLSAPNRFKFSGGSWVSAGIADAQSVAAARLHVHADSPATGAAWTSREVSFHRAKLTNNSLDRSGNLVLTSMHKYMPRVHVVRASDVMALHCSPTATFTFPETEFVAVTAYQNDRITKMKIDNNPFAKGFRETGMSRCKRKQLAAERDASALPRESDLLPFRPHKRSCSDDRSVSSHDDSGMSSLGSATPPASPSASPPLSPTSSTPTPPATTDECLTRTTAVPKCILSIERLLAKDDAPKRASPELCPGLPYGAACCAVPLALPYPYPMYLPAYSPYPYAYPPCQVPYNVPPLFPMEIRPVDLSRDQPRDLSLKREAV